uniref:Uncharacterized protein n=1 Tax=Setaria digitata TaxID=48799 RepID=A0A915PFQ8_9BILA
MRKTNQSLSSIISDGITDSDNGDVDGEKQAAKNYETS